MKARMPNQFYIYASKYSLKSMIEKIAFFTFDIFNNPSSDFGLFGGYRSYSLDIGKGVYNNRTLLAQTWLIDLIYDLACLENTGDIAITQAEALHLVALYSDYSNDRDGKRLCNKSDVFLNLYGFFGEQKRFQNSALFFEEFAREKYILDVISKKKHPKNTYGIDVAQEFMKKTDFSTDDYSSLMFLLFGYFSSHNPIAKLADIKTEFINPNLSASNLSAFIKEYSITIDEIRNSTFKRQVFYAKPIIKIDDDYISVNPFLVLCLFVNSNYWVMRNLYKNKKEDPQRFINAFGLYFEMYVEEVLHNCLLHQEFERIPEVDDKRADWNLKLGNYHFLVEQKSGLSILGIKQSQPDIKMMRKHILENWGEAVRQLNSTQAAFDLINPIKIILVYEDYYKSECLDELFKLDSTICNDGKFWLVTIREFETLIMTYKENPDLFVKIISDKDRAEQEHSRDGRDLEKFLIKHDAIKNNYLKKFGASEEFDKVKNLCK